MFETDPHAVYLDARSGQRNPVTSSAPRSGSKCIRPTPCPQRPSCSVPFRPERRCRTLQHLLAPGPSAAFGDRANDGVCKGRSPTAHAVLPISLRMGRPRKRRSR